MKAPKDSRSRRRTPIKLTSQELAWAEEDALRWRASLRAERNGEVSNLAETAEPFDQAPHRPDLDAEQRARFAAAIARAEFGRVYFKGDSGKAQKARKPRRNGKVLDGRPGG